MKQPARRGSPEKSKSLPPERPREEAMERLKPKQRKVVPASSEEEKTPSRSDSQEKLTSTQQQLKAGEEKMEVDYHYKERNSSPDTETRMIADAKKSYNIIAGGSISGRKKNGERITNIDQN